MHLLHRTFAPGAVRYLQYLKFSNTRLNINELTYANTENPITTRNVIIYGQ